ncbi:MAG: DNA repair protein RadC [Pseudomonadota bacterium]|nr:DNA repair protein RadC [Pseudomonadota bacterium]
MSNEQDQPAPKPHHMGHRDLFRQRFVKGGAASLADYELLELLLFMCIPRRDVKPLAKNLIKDFGSFAAVLNASIPDLVKASGISENTAIALHSVRAAAHHLLQDNITGKEILSNWVQVMDYAKATMAHEKKEHFRVFFLNKKNELIADEVQQSGTVDHTPAYPREVMKRALELGATAIILCHNHPSGDATPSPDDIEMTNRIVDAGRPFNIIVHDHIIVSKSSCNSLRNMDLM